ncbi:hypothetical protein [Streptomyces sodiiphilus]
MAALAQPGNRHRPVSGSADLRLPWWALVLPVLAFGALLFLLVTGGGAGAAETGQPLNELVQQMHRSLLT